MSSAAAPLPLAGRRVRMVDRDAGDSAVIDGLARTAVKELGGLDIWVSNGHIAHPGELAGTAVFLASDASS